MRDPELVQELKQELSFVSKLRDGLVAHGVTNAASLTLARAGLDFAKAASATEVFSDPAKREQMLPALIALLYQTHTIGQTALLHTSPERERRLPKIPRRWPEHKRPGETAVQFYLRVWGPYASKGLIYQDDFERMDQMVLIKSVREECVRMDVDPLLLLPLPARGRLDRAHEMVPPDSAIEVHLRNQIRQRTSPDIFLRSRLGPNPKLSRKRP